MKLAFLLLFVPGLCNCSQLIYKTGWRPRDGTPRTEILAKLSQPAKTAKRSDLPGYAPVETPSMVLLKDNRGREDSYITRRIVAEHGIAWGAFCLDGTKDTVLFLLSEAFLWPIAAVQHWWPPKRELRIYYDLNDRVQAYTLLSLDREKPAASGAASTRHRSGSAKP
jgi:hypothetical protein